MKKKEKEKKKKAVGIQSFTFNKMKPRVR